MMVRCTKCLYTKSVKDFYKDKSRKDGRTTWCKACIKAKNTDWIKNNKTKHTRIAFNSVLKTKYNLDIEAYEYMLKIQDGKCETCGCTESIAGRRLCVDHDHATGKIRGLLCHSCNTALGMVGDDPDVLQRLILYLILHKI